MMLKLVPEKPIISTIVAEQYNIVRAVMFARHTKFDDIYIFFALSNSDFGDNYIPLSLLLNGGGSFCRIGTHKLYTRIKKQIIKKIAKSA